MSRKKVEDEKRRDKMIKFRVNSIEIDTLELASEKLQLEKSTIIRNAIQEYLEKNLEHDV